MTENDDLKDESSVLDALPTTQIDNARSESARDPQRVRTQDDRNMQHAAWL